MAKMRSLAPAFILTIGVLFVLFMVLSDSKLMEIFGAHSNNIGSVNGKDISYQEFVKAVDQQRENQKNQTGQDVDEESMDQFRDQVWDALVSQSLIAEQVKEYGITVTDEEVRDVILGENPPQFLTQNFVDSMGRFNRQLYESALFDARNKPALLQAEEYVKQQRLNEKLQSFLLASITVGEDELKQKFTEQNVRMNAVYVFADASKIADNEVSVTDNDIKDYYDKNLDKYHVDAQRKMKYVLFPFTASSEDSSILARNLEGIVSRLSKNDTLTLKSAAEMYSQFPHSKDSLNITSIPAAISNQIVNANPGALIGPVATPEGMSLFKVNAIVPGKDVFVRAQHILINSMGDDEKNKAEADKIFNQLKSGANFDQIAKEKSGDKSNSDKGGDLGWFGKGQMVPEFEKACFNGKVGEVQSPLKTSYGYHIIKVTGRSDKKYAVEKITAPIKPSAATKDSRFTAAQDFSFIADKNGFEKEAELLKLQVQETTPFTKESNGVPGLGGGKHIIDYAFDNNKGSVSEPFKVANGYAVFMVSENIAEGTRPFNEVKESLKPLVLREKKIAKTKEIIESVKSKINGNLASAPAINNKVTFDTTGSFTIEGSVPKIGRDYNFVHTASVLDINKVSEPVKGQRGYYLIKVMEKTAFDKAAYQAQRSQILAGLLQEKKNTFFNSWLTKLKKDADIVDNRYRFFAQ